MWNPPELELLFITAYILSVLQVVVLACNGSKIMRLFLRQFCRVAPGVRLEHFALLVSTGQTLRLFLLDLRTCSRDQLVIPRRSEKATRRRFYMLWCFVSLYGTFTFAQRSDCSRIARQGCLTPAEPLAVCLASAGSEGTGFALRRIVAYRYHLFELDLKGPEVSSACPANFGFFVRAVEAVSAEVSLSCCH